MYDPASPNNYRKVKIATWKRAREEEQANDVSRALAAAPTPAAVAVATGTTSTTTSGNTIVDTTFSDGKSGSYAFEVASESPPGVGGDVLPLQLSAEELHQRRVRQSAALGITAAMRIERDELEAAHKTKVAAGMDRKGRIGQKLGKLLEVASAKNNTQQNSGTNSTTADGAALHTPLPVSSALLTFHKADLAAGGYVVKEDNRALEKKKTVQGKPSSTILIRFIRDGPPLEVFIDDNNKNSSTPIGSSGIMNSGVAVRNAFLESIQEECGRCGVVRSVRYAVLSNEERGVVRSRLSTSAACDVETLLAREAIRIFVRFDSVANAFKALEALQQKRAQWDVCFFPTQLFDAGLLGPAEGEPLCSV